MNSENGLLRHLDLLLNDPFRTAGQPVATEVGMVTGARFTGRLQAVFDDGLSLTTENGVAFVALAAIASVVLLDPAAPAGLIPQAVGDAERREAEAPPRRRAFHYMFSSRGAAPLSAPLQANRRMRTKLE